MALLLNGIGVSKGVGIGEVHILKRSQHEVLLYCVPDKHIADEVKRFKKAHRQAVKHLEEVKSTIPAHAPEDTVTVINSHLLMLSDDAFKREPVEIIKKEKCNAEWALLQQQDALVKVFDGMEDSYLKTRGRDVEHIAGMLQGFLLEEEYRIQPNKDLKGHIIVTDDLTPSDVILFERQKVAGFITEYGGPVSHTAILARSFNIPLIVAMHDARKLLQQGEQVIMDSSEGVVIASVTKPLLAEYRKKKKLEREHQIDLEKIRDTKAKTLDGTRIKLMANIEINEDIRLLKRCGSDGVGLYRTEFLYIDRAQAADEQEQFLAYRKVLRAANGAPVTIRTLDLGAEKEFDPEYTGPLALNPALGLRGIRRSLKDPEMLLEQLRAIYRASVFGDVRLLIPMLTNASEVHQTLELCEIAKQQLTEVKARFNADIPIGAMIEVPAAALVADTLGSKIDFLSIGTNDLIQYTLAVDRIDEEVSYLYDPLHPSILRLIQMVIDSGQQLKIPVAMCGEMAGNPQLTRLLLAMGLQEFSMHPNNLAEVKNIIIHSKLSALKKQYQKYRQSDKSDKSLKQLQAALNG